MKWSMSAAETFEQAIASSHRALHEIARGNPDAVFELYSRRDDATLANPYGPPACGWSQIEPAGRRAAANYRVRRRTRRSLLAATTTEDR
jgi:hypothetical protein